MHALFRKYGQLLGRCLSDTVYIQICYFYHFGKFANLSKPQSFNEKMQWLKLHNRKSLYTTMADKYAAKAYVGEIIGFDHVVKTLNVWKNAEDIDFNSLPNQFVLKTNQDSGGVIVCRDKTKIDEQRIRKFMGEHLKKNGFWYGREWPYKNITPCVFAEEYIEDQKSVIQTGSNVLNVYKVFTFNGEPRIIQSIQNDKTDNETVDYFDLEWNRFPFRQSFPCSKKPLPKPVTLSEMLSFARILSKGFQFLRVDFYEVDEKVFFSEFTFFSDSGFTRFFPEKWDRELGDWIKL